MLNDIVSDLEQLGQLQAQDLKDTLFFTTAMDLARYNFNFNIAERIHNILLSGNNYKFIGSQYRVKKFISKCLVIFFIFE